MRLRAATALVLLVALCACSGSDDDVTVTPVTLPTITAEPDDFPGKDWQRAERGEWSALDAELRRNGSTCVAVVQDGELIHDAYWNGGSKHTRQRVYSITKSLTSLLIGMAADLGAIELDDTASEEVDEWRVGPAEAVTVHDLLSMTSGRHWDESTDRRMIRDEPDKTTFAVNLAQERPPGEDWVYDNSAVQALESVLDDVYESDDVVENAERRLLDPLGMRDTTWARDNAGNALMYSGVESTCLDMARVGHLMLNRGAWDGEQVVSEAYVDRATHASSDLNAAYGLLWWVNAKGRVVEVLRQAGFPSDKAAYEGQLAPDVPDDAFWAFGYGNQYIAVVPSEGIVAVRLGTRPPTPDAVTFESFTKGVLAGVK